MAAKVCPMCHHGNPRSAWQCGDCGYEFGQSLEKVQTLLRDQRTTSAILLSVLLVVDIGAITAVLWAAVGGFFVVPMLCFLVLISMTVHTGRKLLITRKSLRQLAERHALPTAIVRRR
jgi:hypothetical protein